jgi:hypothetical protein
VKLPQLSKQLQDIIPQSCQELRALFNCTSICAFETASLNSPYIHLITGTDVTWCGIMSISDVLCGFLGPPTFLHHAYRQLSLGIKRVKLITHYHLMPRLKNTRRFTSTPSYICMP